MLRLSILPSIAQVDPEALTHVITSRTVTVGGGKLLQLAPMNVRQAERFRDQVAAAVHDVLIRSIAEKVSQELGELKDTAACLSELLPPDLLLRTPTCEAAQRNCVAPGFLVLPQVQSHGFADIVPVPHTRTVKQQWVSLWCG